MHLEREYKPITKPLQKFLANIKTDVQIKKEPEGDTSIAVSQGSSTPKKRNIPQYLPTTIPSFLELSEIEDTNKMNIDELSSNSSADIEEEVERSRQYIRQFGAETYEDWLSTFHILPRTYIDNSVRDIRDEFDHKYGVKPIVHDSSDKFIIANSKLLFQGKDVVVAGLKYPGTSGLYELLFKKFPVGYTDTDLEHYMDILKRTNAYRQYFKPDGKLQGSTSLKYKSVIRPYLVKKGLLKLEKSHTASSSFAKPPPPTSLRPRSHTISTSRALRSAKSQEGKGIMMNLSNRLIDYVYFNDPNELVDRLKLLVASKAAGNTGHNNEIVSIIEELQEAGIVIK